MKIRIRWYHSVIVNGQAVAHFRSLCEAIRVSNDIRKNRPNVTCIVERA